MVNAVVSNDSDYNEEIIEKIRDIINRGNIVCFTNKINGCPLALDYEITEIVKQ